MRFFFAATLMAASVTALAQFTAPDSGYLPGDILVLQERPGESVGRYLSQTFRLTTAFDAVRSASLTSTGTTTNP